jgi:hypothetical protein
MNISIVQKKDYETTRARRTTKNKANFEPTLHACYESAIFRTFSS